MATNVSAARIPRIARNPFAQLQALKAGAGGRGAGIPGITPSGALTPFVSGPGAGIANFGIALANDKVASEEAQRQKELLAQQQQLQGQAGEAMRMIAEEIQNGTPKSVAIAKVLQQPGMGAALLMSGAFKDLESFSKALTPHLMAVQPGGSVFNSETGKVAFTAPNAPVSIMTPDQTGLPGVAGVATPKGITLHNMPDQTGESKFTHPGTDAQGNPIMINGRGESIPVVSKATGQPVGPKPMKATPLTDQENNFLAQAPILNDALEVMKYTAPGATGPISGIPQRIMARFGGVNDRAILFDNAREQAIRALTSGGLASSRALGALKSYFETLPTYSHAPRANVTNINMMQNALRTEVSGKVSNYEAGGRQIGQETYNQLATMHVYSQKSQTPDPFTVLQSGNLDSLTPNMVRQLNSDPRTTPQMRQQLRDFVAQKAAAMAQPPQDAGKPGPQEAPKPQAQPGPTDQQQTPQPSPAKPAQAPKQPAGAVTPEGSAPSSTAPENPAEGKPNVKLTPPPGSPPQEDQPPEDIQGPLSFSKPLE